MNKRWAVLTAVSVLLAANAAFASTMTFATFADPSGNASNPLFRISPDFDAVSASYTGPGLTLQVPFTSQVFNNVTFAMPEVAVDEYGVAAPGSIQFFDGPSLLMTIHFQSARLSEFGFGARNRTSSPNIVDIVYNGTPITPALTEESFSFSFTNFGEDGQGWTTTTAAFTSAAIPEPATLVFLAMGCVSLLRRRR